MQGHVGRVLMYVIAMVSFGMLLFGANSFRSAAWRVPAGNSATDPVTGYPSAGIQDQEIRSFLERSGYEGGGSVVQVIDPVTGRPSGSFEDEHLREWLRQSGYEGGGTVIRDQGD